MMNAKEIAWVYQMMLSTPGMNLEVKIDLRISRKLALWLCQAIARGVKDGKSSDEDLFSYLPKEAVQELEQLSEQFLEKSGMMETTALLKGYGK